MIHFLFFSLIFLSGSPVAIKDVLSFYLFVQFCSSDKVDNFQKINGLVMTMMLTIVMAKVMIRVVEVMLHFFFLSGFSFTDTDDSQGSRGREGSIFYSTLPLPPAHEHSDIYLQLCTWDDYHIFLIAALVFTRLLLDEIYHLIELLFDWLMM